MSPPPRRRKRRLAKVLLALATLLVTGVIGEGVLRLAGGYRLFSVRLESSGPAESDPEAVLAMAHQVVDPFAELWATARPDLDIGWLKTSPPPLPPQPKLERPSLPQHDWLLNYYVLNEIALRSPPGQALLNSPELQVPNEFTVFRPPGNKPAPHYRYPASRTLPTGLVTNAFGFRGRDLPVDKPAKTIRIAFVGASTTVEAHSLPHSAPELIEHWLNTWAKSRGLDIAFETLNGAREAIKSRDIAAIIEDEVLPLAVDYVVYYEGANQFQPATLKKHIEVDGDYQLASPPPGVVGVYDETQNTDTTWLDGAASHLAIARYLRNALAGSERLAEPDKPNQRITLASELRKGKFPLGRAAEVLELAAISRDLAAIRSMVEARGAKFVLSTFWWLAQDGMQLDPVWARNVHVHLNRAYWPFRYSLIAELAAVQNRFFAAWAAENKVDLIDVGGKLPQHEQLAIDAIHHNEVGVHLKAWIMFAELTRIVERDLKAGSVPVPDAQRDERHPNIGPTKMLTRAELGK